MIAEPATEIDAQYRAMREECGMLEREGRTLFELAGPEGAEFLQGQLTNEIDSLEPGRGCYAALLDRKGKVRADMRVLRIESDLILLETDEAVAAEVFKHLSTYKVGREVEIARREGARLLSLLGPATAPVLGGIALGPEHSHRSHRIEGAEVRLVVSAEGADLVLGDEDAGAVAEALLAAGAVPVSPRAAEIIRVEAGRPRFGSEMGNETIPQEAGINERAVSFEKGCYIGQETVARLHYRGKPNRHLRRLSSERVLSAGAEVKLDGKVLGTIGTAVISPARGPLALAILRREAVPGVEVEVGEDNVATVEEISA